MEITEKDWFTLVAMVQKLADDKATLSLFIDVILKTLIKKGYLSEDDKRKLLTNVRGNNARTFSRDPGRWMKLEKDFESLVQDAIVRLNYEDSE